MRSIRGSVARSAHVADGVAAMHRHSFAQSWGVMVQVPVVIAVNLLRVELIYCQAALLAEKKLPDEAIVHGQNRRTARRENIGGFMGTWSVSSLIESILNILRGETGDRQPEPPPDEAIRSVDFCRGRASRGWLAHNARKKQGASQTQNARGEAGEKDQKRPRSNGTCSLRIGRSNRRANC